MRLNCRVHVGGQRHFNSRTSCEMRRKRDIFSFRACISTHAPLARCDLPPSQEYHQQGYFNSRTSCEVRLQILSVIPNICSFQLTHLLRGATISATLFFRTCSFQLTHLLRGATRIIISFVVLNHISTHAPLARCDFNFRHFSRSHSYFNSRTSCEVRHDTVKICRIPKEFQLTHLLRGATQNALKICCAGKFQLTHLLRGATKLIGENG